MAQATSKRIEAENNLEISISDFKTVVGREPNVNWYDSDETKIIESNPKDWSKFGKLPNLPNSLENSIKTGLTKNPDYQKLQLQLQNSKLHKKILNFAPEFSLSGSVGNHLILRELLKELIPFLLLLKQKHFNKGHNYLNREKSKDSALTIIKSLETKNSI